jgi:glycosyl transferase, family 25
MDIPVFVLNLDRSPDRLAAVRGEARRIGMTFERFPAVDGRDVPSHFRDQFLDKDGNSLSKLNDGQIGCYASHLSLHRRIVRDGLPYAMIVEDDSRFQDDLMLAATCAIEAAPAGWDYIHLSGILKRAVLSVASLPNGRYLVRHSRLPVNTAGYLISLKGAAKMLKPGPRLRPVDMEIRHAWLRDLDVFGIYPSPVSLSDEFTTTIGTTFRRNRMVMNVWSPGLMSEMRGRFYSMGKLGIAGYYSCAMANLRLGILKVCFRRKGSGECRFVVPIVVK